MRLRILSAPMNAIRRIRKTIFQVNQAEFAAIAGVTQATVSRWEDDNNNAEPSRGEMDAIRRAAADRAIEWDDMWFFEAPTSAADDAIQSPASESEAAA